MKAKILIGCAVFLVAGALAVSPVSAGSGWYVGIATGSTSVDLNVADFDDGGITSGEVDDGGIGWKVFGGYQIIKYLAVEGGFTDLNEVTFDGISDGTGLLYAAGPVSSVFDVNGSFVNVVGILPITPMFAVIGKVGILNWDGDFTLVDTVDAITGSDDGSDPMYSFGVEILPSAKCTLRAEYELYSEVFDEDVDRVSASLLIR
ncbi:MAG: outer membrane beta-barrel protein, partial [Acidobacteriota bacterium]